MNLVSFYRITNMNLESRSTRRNLERNFKTFLLSLGVRMKAVGFS
jgi:hypothetical protein